MTSDKYCKCDFCPKQLPNGTCLRLAKWGGSCLDELWLQRECEQAIERMTKALRRKKK